MASSIPERSTTEWQALDAAHYIHPFTDHAALSEKGTRVITRAEGVYLYESGGRRILDGMSGLWCVNLGYGRRELAEAAYKQMQELPYYNSFFQVAHPPAIELARLLSEVTPPQFKHVFFTGSGSEANDTVVRTVRHYWNVLGQPERSVIISRHNAYHGSTMAGASLGGMKPMHEQGGLPIPGIVHIRQPYWFGEGGDLSPEEFGLVAARALEEKILQIGPEKVAAFIGEPIQGAGGVIIPPSTYWPEIQRIVDKYGILLVADEVICGFGRTGRWFGSEYFGIRPDLMPIAKGLSSGYLPIGGVMVGDRVAEVMTTQAGEFNHGFTYSGHPAACAVACAAIKILRDERIVERVHDDVGPYLQRRWQELASHPLVGEARIVGLIGALELVKDKARRQFFPDPGDVGVICRDLCIANGLVMRAVRDTMIIAPPLVITHAQIDELVEKARLALDQTQQELQRQGRF
ncbi:aspartate aminotransferase family protein [Steroidobacter agaridevorans]|uniref:aspartate aminotransferase family protein n=1 Tax=Steroidobacter agaridevorans TaxID=2695856 RepID=UPI0013221694|nr:aspartate aminotransferase family protein [Steroidobacter agaridevorans]GFE91690.1 aspartate aminotransferase family protein [Steroidobacter agaridevorans]